jgi:hypothetical protein
MWSIAQLRPDGSAWPAACFDSEAAAREVWASAIERRPQLARVLRDPTGAIAATHCWGCDCRKGGYGWTNG